MVAPRRCPDAVTGALRVVVGDGLVELDLASQNLGCPPPKRADAHHTTRGRQEARLV